jgi:hypothetical protein
MRIGTYEQEILKKGLKGRLWFWRKEKEILNDNNFLTDLKVIKQILFQGGNVGKHWVDGKFVWNVWVDPRLTEENNDFVEVPYEMFENSKKEKKV